MNESKRCTNQTFLISYVNFVDSQLLIIFSHFRSEEQDALLYRNSLQTTSARRMSLLLYEGSFTMQVSIYNVHVISCIRKQMYFSTSCGQKTHNFSQSQYVITYNFQHLLHYNTVFYIFFENHVQFVSFSCKLIRIFTHCKFNCHAKSQFIDKHAHYLIQGDQLCVSDDKKEPT